jgi:hypothetical protein
MFLGVDEFLMFLVCLIFTYHCPNAFCKIVFLLPTQPMAVFIFREFVNNVRFIKILSPPEVLQMSQDDMELWSSIPTQQQTSSSSEDCVARNTSRNINSVLTSTGSLDY